MNALSLGLICLLCSVDWTLSQSHFNYIEGDYALSTAVKLNWFQAEAFCASQGYNLVKITSESRQQLIYNLIRKSKLQPLLTDPIWTSGTNLAVATQWNWFSSGEPILYRNFHNDPSGTTYRCLALSATTGKWSTENCNDQRYFICEKSC